MSRIRVPLRFWVLSAIVLLLNAAGLLVIRAELKSGRLRPVRIIAALPARDVDTTDRFVLVFDEPLADPRQVDQPLTRAPFRIEPALEGQWTWSAADRLEFRLAAALPPGRIFTIRPTADCESQLGRQLAGPQEFHFQTRELELLGCEFVGGDRTHVNLEFRFNQPVVPADLMRCLRLTSPDDPRALHVVALTVEAGERIVVRSDRPPKDEVSVRVDKSLAGHQAELPLGVDVTRRVKVPQAFALLRAEVETPGLEKLLDVTLCFSRRLDRNQSVPAVNVSPFVDDLRARIGYGSLTLTGPFESGKRYSATLGPTVLSEAGDTLGEVQTVSFEIPDRRPRLRFPRSSGILAPGGNNQIELEAVNVGTLVLRAARVHANNLAAELHGDSGIKATSRELPEKTIPLKLPHNVPTKVLLDLRGLIDQPRGVYHVEASAADCRWVDDDAVVALTDLGLTVKQERGGVLVWVTSLTSGQPVIEASVSAYSYNNQVLATAKTDREGVARLAIPEHHPDGPAWLITAEHDGDLGFLQPDERRWVLDDVDQSGRPAPTTYDVLLYAERGAYRPGDTIHLTGMVRDASGQVPPPFPLALRVTRPDGRKVAELPVTIETTGQGVFHVDYPTLEDGQLGRYRFAAALPGADQPLGDLGVLVEEFVPVRMEVRAETTFARFGPAEPPTIRVGARYLFDQPAARLPLTVSGNFQRVPFKSSKYPAFVFGDAEAKESRGFPKVVAGLDEQGQATVELPRPEVQFTGLWRGLVVATVTEPGGRSVSCHAEVLVDTADRHVGLRLPAGRIVPADAPVEVEWLVVNGVDEPADGAIEFSLARVEHDWVVEEVDRRPVWKSIERLVPLVKRGATTTVGVQQPGRTTFELAGPGQYRLRAVEKRSTSLTQLDFFATSEPAQSATLLPNRPERVEIVLDRDAYVPGETARALLRSPFAGTLLLTLENDQVLMTRVLGLDGNAAEVELPVPPTLRGGAFVTATVVRGIDPAQGKWLPARALGLARLTADHSSHELPLRLVAPTAARPGDSVNVRIEVQAPATPVAPASQPTTHSTTTPAAASQPTSMPATPPPAVVHLWAVDEGILITTDYETPRPLEHFLGPRKLEVSTADVFADLLPDYRRPATMSRIGGDAGEELALRRSPVPARRRAPAVVWRRSAPVEPDGTLTVPLDLPRITGEVRLMAVAAAGDCYGTAQQAVTLSTPFLVEAAWPRFVAPGDRFEVPVKLFNSTKEPLDVALSASVAGPLTLALPKQADHVRVEPGRPETLWVSVSALADPGQVTVQLTAVATTSAGERVVETSDADFPVRPVAPVHTEVRCVRIRAGETSAIDLPGEFLPGTASAKLTVAADPNVELLPALDQLLDYPYGCVEQTTSRLFALLYAPELLREEGSGRARHAADMLEGGILRLWSMQTRDGGLSFWPGSPHSQPWPSAYVAHFLLAAKHAGVNADRRFVDELLKYLKAHLYGDTGGEIDDNVRALMCHVLAGFEQPQEGWLALLAERLDRLDMGGRAHLAGAWLELGRKDRALAALPDDTISLSAVASTGGRITSKVHQAATLLLVLLELDREHTWIPVLARELENARVQSHWGNTLENATALAALARYQSLGPPPGIFDGTVLVGGQAPFHFDHAQPATFRFPMTGEPVQISSSGSGQLYVVVQTRGLRAGAPPCPFDRQLAVRRQWLDADGKAVGLGALRVGDLVRVRIALAAPGLKRGERIENVAIVDALPGGMEVEHPRLVTSAGAHAVSEPRTVDRVEFRDDRVIVFASAEAEKEDFEYALRVITAGQFAIPPIEASCMYDPSFASLSGGGTLEVRR